MGFLDPKPLTTDAGNAAYAPALVSGKAPVRKDELMLTAADRGAIGSGTIDNTGPLQQLINDGTAKRVGIGAGYYLTGPLTANNPIKIQGNSGDFARFATNGIYNSVQVAAKSGTTAPMLTVNSVAVTLEGGISFSGAGLSCLGLQVLSGLQFRQKNTQYVSFASTAIDYAFMANAVVEDIFVDNSGSTTTPAVMIRSNGVNSRTNNFRLNRLTIERSQNTALAIGTIPSGVTPDLSTHWAEWVFFNSIHIESSLDNGGLANVDPVIDIGNVRNVLFSGGQVYGGPGPLLRHTQTLNQTYGNGGIVISGGFWLGSDTGAGASPTPYLIDLVAGDNFTITGGALFDRYTTAAIRIGANYGPNVTIDPSVLATGVLIEDNRTGARKPYTVTGDLKVAGHLTATQTTVPALANGSGTTGHTLLGGASTDYSGKVYFGTTATPPVAGALLTQLTFNRSYGAEKAVSISPGNSATAALGLFSVITSDGSYLKVYCSNAPAASQGNTAYQYSYRVG